MKKLIGVAFAILCIFQLVDYGRLKINYLLKHISSAVHEVGGTPVLHRLVGLLTASIKYVTVLVYQLVVNAGLSVYSLVLFIRNF